jgi:hypothetical protein
MRTLFRASLWKLFSAAYIASSAERSNDNANFIPGKLMEAIFADYALDERTYKAIKTHLQTRAYTTRNGSHGNLWVWTMRTSAPQRLLHGEHIMPILTKAVNGIALPIKGANSQTSAVRVG